MCIRPNYVDVLRGPKWEKVPVPCKVCWRCRKNRVENYVARAQCEAAVSKSLATLTLTYAPRDDLADKVIHLKHFQLFMKRLRRSGHLVRYLVAGEYGELKGRAHFHAILFINKFADLPPCEAPMYNWNHKFDPEGSQPFGSQLPHQQNCHVREWPHGHIFVDWSASIRSIRYVCKYVLSDDKNSAWFSLSKKPPLGAAWFAQKAEIAKSHGVLPSSFQYLPPGSTQKHPAFMTGATRRDYLNAITQNPADKPRMTEWVLKTFEKHERTRLLDELNSQSPEALEEAFNEQREAQAEQTALMRQGHQWREAGANLQAMLSSPDGLLRLVDGRWVPSTEGKANARKKSPKDTEGT